MGMKQKRCPACNKRRRYDPDQVETSAGWQIAVIAQKSVTICATCAKRILAHYGARGAES